MRGATSLWRRLSEIAREGYSRMHSSISLSLTVLEMRRAQKMKKLLIYAKLNSHSSVVRLPSGLMVETNKQLGNDFREGTP